MAAERLQKLLAHAGVASRRAAEELIRAGRVAVDGVVVTELGSKADLASQRVTVDGQPLGGPQQTDYWMVHKPPGVVSTAADPQGRTRVTELLPPEVAGRLYPVGRLDLDSEGLVLLTNDGELAYRLMHPRFAVPKHYRVWVAGRPSLQALQRLRTGVSVEGRLTAPARVSLSGGSPLRSKMTFILHEGRKREIRLMCAAVGHPVQRLVRLGLGPLKLGDLPMGAARRLTPGEVAALKAAGAGRRHAAAPEACREAPASERRAAAPGACREAPASERAARAPGERSPKKEDQRAGRRRAAAPGACREAPASERAARAPGERSPKKEDQGAGRRTGDRPAASRKVSRRQHGDAQAGRKSGPGAGRRRKGPGGERQPAK